MEKEVNDGYMKSMNELDEYVDVLIKENKLPLQESRSQIAQVIECRDHVSKCLRYHNHMICLAIRVASHPVYRTGGNSYREAERS